MITAQFPMKLSEKPLGKGNVSAQYAKSNTNICYQIFPNSGNVLLWKESTRNQIYLPM